jgi:hypothetical protein
MTRYFFSLKQPDIEKSTITITQEAKWQQQLPKLTDNRIIRMAFINTG